LDHRSNYFVTTHQQLLILPSNNQLTQDVYWGANHYSYSNYSDSLVYLGLHKSQNPVYSLRPYSVFFLDKH